MDSVIAQLKINKPNIVQKTIDTYSNIYKHMHKIIWKDAPIELKNFDDTDKIMEYIDASKTPKTAEGKYAAVLSLTNNQLYRDKMNHYSKIVADANSTNTKNKKETDNWITQDEIKTIVEQYKEDFKCLLNAPKLDLMKMQNFIILALTSGYYIPVQRSLNWTEMKIRNIDTTKDNYINKKEFVFNTYKNSAHLGPYSVKIPVKLRKILMKWIAHNPTDYMLFSSTYSKLEPSQLTQRLNLIFGKNVSINMLRKIAFSTEENIQAVKGMKKLSEQMKASRSSINYVDNYIKS